LFAYTVDAADRLGNDTYLLDPETGETGALNTGAVDYVEGLQFFNSAKRNGKEVIILFYGTTPPAVMLPAAYPSYALYQQLEKGAEAMQPSREAA
jgi:hypothetical protein